MGRDRGGEEGKGRGGHGVGEEEGGERRPRKGDGLEERKVAYKVRGGEEGMREVMENKNKRGETKENRVKV